MSNKRSYVVIVGARPNFIKLAPFMRRAKEYPDLEFTLVHTGQHFDENMSKMFFDQMGIPKPEIHFDIQAQFHTEKIGKMFSSLKSVVGESTYDGVVVFGAIETADGDATGDNCVIAIERGKARVQIRHDGLTFCLHRLRLVLGRHLARLEHVADGFPKLTIFDLGRLAGVILKIQAALLFLGAVAVKAEFPEEGLNLRLEALELVRGRGGLFSGEGGS